MTMIPKYIEWDYIGLCGIAGKSGSGKSSTMRLLLAQMALAGTGLIVADGHGKFGRQTLASTIESLSPAFILPTAIEDEDIYRAIESAYRIATWRRETWKGSNDPPMVALVIDEITNIITRFDNERAQFIIKALVFFATEARKTNVKTFIAAQNWTQDFIGSAAVRKSMNTIILHRVAPDEVAKFTTLSSVKKNVPNMRVGEAWILNGEAPVRVYIPKITQDDLLSVTHLIPEYKMSPDVKVALYGVSSEEIIHETNYSSSNSISSTISRNSQFLVNDKTLKLINIWYKEFTKLTKQGMNKRDVIYTLWHVYPGSSAKYRIASKLYDTFKARIDKQEIETKDL